MIRTTISPTEIFDRESLTRELGLTKSTLSREVRLGRLRPCNRGKKDFFIGADVLDWLRAGEVDRSKKNDDEDDEEDE